MQVVHKQSLSKTSWIRYSSNNFFEKWSVGRNFPPLKHEKRQMVIMPTRVGKLPILIQRIQQRLKIENTHRTRARGYLRHLALILFFHKVAEGGLLSKLELWAKGSKRSWITPTMKIKSNKTKTSKNRSQAPTESVFCSSFVIPYKNFFRLCVVILGCFGGIIEWHFTPIFPDGWFFRKNVTFLPGISEGVYVACNKAPLLQRISAHDQLLKKPPMTFFP